MSSSIIYPYRFASDELQFTVESVEIDGDASSGRDTVDAEHQTINLMGLENPWGSLSIRVHVSDPHEKLKECLHPSASLDDVSLWVVVRNSRTRIRRSFKLSELEGHWQGDIQLGHAEMFLSTELSCFASLDQDYDPQEGFAHLAHDRIADIPNWTIYTDTMPPMPGGSMNSEWVNFGESDRPELRERNDCVWYLDLTDASSPKILLNEGVPQLKPALLVESKTSKGARVRDALIGSILQGVLGELVTFSLTTSQRMPLDEVPDWQRKMLLSLARLETRASERLVAQDWLDSWPDAGQIGRVLSETATTIQRHLRIVHSTTHLAKSVEKEFEDA